MKLVGAKISTMKIPIILNGVMIGLFSSVICVILYNLVLLLLNRIYINLNFIAELQIVNLLILLIGILLGLIGSVASSNRISKMLNG